MGDVEVETASVGDLCCCLQDIFEDVIIGE